MTTSSATVAPLPSPSRPPEAAPPARRHPLLAVARWSAQHRWTVLVGLARCWSSVALVAGSATGTRSLSEADTAVGRSAPPSGRWPAPTWSRQPVESVLVRSRTARTVDAAVTAAAEQVRARAAALPGVAGVDAPQTAPRRPQRGGAAPGCAPPAATPPRVADEADRLVRPGARGDRRRPGRAPRPAGAAGGRGLGRGGPRQGVRRGLPPRGAAEPPGDAADPAGRLRRAGRRRRAGAARAHVGGRRARPVGARLALVPSSDSTARVVLLIGLAVGVDYSLFYVRREREERAAGRGRPGRDRDAAPTSGRAVLVSGHHRRGGDGRACSSPATPCSPRFAVGTILVVAVAVLGSLTVLPAMLALLGDGVDRPRLPCSAGARRGRWRALAAPARPRAGPARGRLGLGGRRAGRARRPGAGHAHQPARHRDCPARVPVVQAYDRLAAASRSPGAPHTVAVWYGPPAGPAGGRAVARARCRRRRQRPRDRPATSRTPACQHGRAGGRGRLPLGTPPRTPGRAVARPAARPAGAGDRRHAPRRTTGGRRARPPARRTSTPSLRERLPLVFGFVLVLTVPGDAGGVPVAGRGADRDRAQPALGGRGVRAAGAGLPARLGRGAARLHLDRRGRGLAAAVPVRDPVRAVDGLPRLRRQPGPRGGAARGADPARRSPRGSRARPAWSPAPRS